MQVSTYLHVCMHVIIMTAYIILLCTSIYGIVDPWHCISCFYEVAVEIRLANQTQVCVSLFPNHSVML